MLLILKGTKENEANEILNLLLFPVFWGQKPSLLHKISTQ